MSYKSNKLCSKLVNKYTKWVSKNMYVETIDKKKVYIPFDKNAKALEKIVQNRKLMATGRNAYDLHPKHPHYENRGISLAASLS